MWPLSIFIFQSQKKTVHVHHVSSSSIGKKDSNTEGEKEAECNLCLLWNLVPAWNHLMFQPLLDLTFAVDGAARGWVHPTVHHLTFLFTFKSGAIWESPISLTAAITERKTHGRHKEMGAREKNMQMLRSEAQSKPGCSCCAANCRTAVPRRNTCGPAVSLHSHCLCSFQEIDRRED